MADGKPPPHPPQWTMGRARMRWIARVADDAAIGAGCGVKTRRIIGWAFTRKLLGGNGRWPVPYLRELAGTELWDEPLLGWLRKIAAMNGVPDPDAAVADIRAWPPGLADSEHVYMGHDRQLLIAHGLADGLCAASASGHVAGLDRIFAVGDAVAAAIEDVNSAPPDTFSRMFESRIGRRGD